MATPSNILLEESKCYTCLGISLADALELALLNTDPVEVVPDLPS